jgi:putative oxidoreductase
VAKGGGSNWGTLIPRFVLGIVFVFHGGQKLFGLFGGEPGTIDNLAGFIASWGWPLPRVQAYAVGVTEFFGGACLLLGLMTRFWALGLAVTMAVAALKVHWPNGFGGLPAEAGSVKPGWEYNFVLGVLALSLAVQGGGALSLDEMFFRKKKPEGPPPE